MVTESDELVDNEPETLDIATYPLAEEDNDLKMSSKEDSTPEEDPVDVVVTNLWSKNQGSYSTLKESLFTAKKFMKGFEDLSRTQMKKKLYKEKMKHIKALKRQYPRYNKSNTTNTH